MFQSSHWNWRYLIRIHSLFSLLLLLVSGLWQKKILIWDHGSSFSNSSDCSHHKLAQAVSSKSFTELYRCWTPSQDLDSSNLGQLLGFPCRFCYFTKGTILPCSSMYQFSMWHYVWKLQADGDWGCMECSAEHIRPLLFGKFHMKFNYLRSHSRDATHPKVHRKRKIINLYVPTRDFFFFFQKEHVDFLSIM